MPARPAPRSVSVCFVCLGNICRSPTAQGVMQRLVEEAQLGDRVFVQSAGTAGHHAGDPPDPRSRAAARARGIELSSRARQFARADWARFDYVVAMDRQNFDDLDAHAPDPSARIKLRLLRAFDVESPLGASVPDPYYGGADGFEHVLDLCEAACAGLMAEIRREHQL